MPLSLEQWIKRSVALLTDYQDAAYAAQYAKVVEAVRAAEAPLGSDKLSMTVARQLSRLMAYKDEYEVARLYTNGQFQQALAQQFEGDFTLSFHLAPPILARKDGQGYLLKARYGGWMMTAFKLLARMKGLRGGVLDIFGRTAERRMERALIVQYRSLVLGLLPRLTTDNLPTAIELAQLPQLVRGYGHVKQQAVEHMHARQASLLAAFERAGQPSVPAAA
ncbi:DUF6537 domain-containing protein [Herbaspirillum sp. B65]|uniref:DUF6537 domain-containing protein n=1 Tax=Herbaspirillum sp. B65 TaxID=137708 RepID=UPI00034C7403